MRTFPLLLFSATCMALTSPDPLPHELPGLHNLHRVSGKLLSGSGPEGELGFSSLKTLGVKTIISVDGAKPDVERARKLGMRYVHLPIGYNGVPAAQGLRIARAVRDLPGPVYIHCHHGKHRGPAAAAVAKLCLDPQCTVAAALDFLRQAGTDKRYTGLYDSVRSIKCPTLAELDKVSAEFPEATAVSALAQAMVEIDEHFEALKLAKGAAWKTPPAHPDIDPPHEAAILAQFYQGAAKNVKKPQLGEWLVEAEQNAQAMSTLLRKVKSGVKIENDALEKAFQRMNMDCSRCHARYRDALDPP